MALLNPYQDPNGSPKLRKSLTVFLDILGYSERMRVASRTGEQQSDLQTLKEALSEGYRPLQKEEKLTEEESLWPYESYKLKIFTDNIVLGIPITDDGEDELGLMVNLIGGYQFTLALRGLFVRGGVTVGDIYIDDDLVYGTALLDAYQAQVSLARDPRIVLDSRAMEIVHQHLTYYGDVCLAPHNEDLLVDSDGQLFLNYLMIPLYGESPNDDYFRHLDLHRTAVRQRLTEFLDQPQIWSKYAWVANYHNIVCTEFLEAPDHVIEQDLLQRPARRLDRVYRKVGDSIYRGETPVAKWKSILWQKHENP